MCIRDRVRALASLTRNIPEAVWAVLLLPLLWYGDFLGFLVLCIISYGFLTRSFADSIDETNASCIKALEATGANYWQIVVHAVIPETMPSLISWTLYAAENNIRSATVVGMLAGGGIGYLMSIYQGGLYILSLIHILPASSSWDIFSSMRAILIFRFFIAALTCSFFYVYYYRKIKLEKQGNMKNISYKCKIYIALNGDLYYNANRLRRETVWNCKCMICIRALTEEKSCMEFPFPYQAARHWDCWDVTVPVSLRRFAF